MPISRFPDYEWVECFSKTSRCFLHGGVRYDFQPDPFHGNRLVLRVPNGLARSLVNANLHALRPYYPDDEEIRRQNFVCAVQNMPEAALRALLQSPGLDAVVEILDRLRSEPPAPEPEAGPDEGEDGSEGEPAPDARPLVERSHRELVELCAPLVKAGKITEADVKRCRANAQLIALLEQAGYVPVPAPELETETDEGNPPAVEAAPTA